MRAGLRAPSGAGGHIPSRVWFRLGFAYALLGGLAWLLRLSAAPDDWWVHGAWCIAAFAIAVPTLATPFRYGVGIALTEHRLMFLASFCLYFAFGASLLAFGADIEVDAAQRFYRIDVRDALRVDAINSLGFGISLLVAAVTRGRWLGRLTHVTGSALSGVPTHVVIGAFLLLGTVASGYLLSFDLGIRQGLVPGVIRTAATFSLVAVLLAASFKGRGEFVLRALAIALVVALAAAGALLFNKSAVLLPVAAFTLGLSIRFGPKRVLPLGLLLLIVGYLSIGNIATYGRLAIGARSVPDLAERWQILQEGWRDTRDLSEAEEYGAWARLCYTSAQAAGLDLRDDGRGGDGMALLPWVFVPRMLADDKPEITVTGRDFNSKITGNEGSSTGQGIFASGYYHGGWWGLLLASVLCGWIVAQTSAISSAIASTRAVVLAPLSLLGLLIAFRIDGDFVSDYVGAFVFILYPLLALSVLFRFGARTKRQHLAARP